MTRGIGGSGRKTRERAQGCRAARGARESSEGGPVCRAGFRMAEPYAIAECVHRAGTRGSSERCRGASALAGDRRELCLPRRASATRERRARRRAPSRAREHDLREADEKREGAAERRAKARARSPPALRHLLGSLLLALSPSQPLAQPHTEAPSRTTCFPCRQHRVHRPSGAPPPRDRLDAESERERRLVRRGGGRGRRVRVLVRELVLVDRLRLKDCVSGGTLDEEEEEGGREGRETHPRAWHSASWRHRRR